MIVATIQNENRMWIGMPKMVNRTRQILRSATVWESTVDAPWR
jgi:hypothetical protein